MKNRVDKVKPGSIAEEVGIEKGDILLSINDNYKKVILTMDNVKNKQIDGIEVINIIDFLMN